MTKQRVLFIVPSLIRAGAENQLVQLVNGLPGESFDKHLLSYLPEKDLLPSVDQRSVTYHAVRRERKIDFQTARTIGQIIDKNQIDVVHCTLENALLYGLLGVRFSARTPTVLCAIHTTTLATLKHRIADVLLYRHLLKKCAQVWFMCRTQAALWTRRMPFLADSQRVVYNGIRTEAFNPDDYTEAGRDFRERHGIPIDAKIICCVAGLRPEKYHDVLLRSFSILLRRTTKDCYLLLAGSGEMASSLEQLAGQLGIESRVIFLGALTDVRPLLAAADCKVLASKAETFSMAMLEAMAMQVPVISTNVGGAAEAIVDRESGLLITPGDAEDLADKLAWLLTDDERMTDIGRAARDTVVQKFTYPNMVERSSVYLSQAN